MDNTVIAKYGTPAVVGLFLLLLWLQLQHPLRRWVLPKLRHLVINLVVGGVAAVLAQLVVLPVGLAVTAWTARERFGLLHWMALPGWLSATLGFVLLDFTFYYWHRWNHVWGFLWRFHNVHHADPDLDVSTALRFHFGEIALSTAFRVVQLGLIGVATPVYLVFEFVFGVAVQFHHANLRLPWGLERALNWLIVTPRMHGIHHSVIQRETNSNYSTIFCWWDKLHGSFHPLEVHEGVVIGVPAYNDPRDQRIPALLAMPFRRQREYWAWAASGEREADVSPRSG